MGPRRVGPPSQEGAQAPDGDDRLQARPRLSTDERFPRSSRLVGGPDVRRVLQSGHRARRTHFDISWLAGTAAQPRMGLIVPRFRHTAPERNRLRRRLKEIWRRDLQHVVPLLDVVIRTRRDTYRVPFATLRADLLAWRDAVA